MKQENFYNQFHKKSSSQKKIISKNNFTYFTILKNIQNILSLIPKNSKILDFGCGSGTLSFYLSSCGYNLTGVDISPAVIKIAKKSAKQMKSNVKLHTLKGFKRQMSKKYDLILCIEVIEHVKNDEQLLKEMRNCLKPGGYLYISTPSANAPLYKLGLLNKFDKEVGHLRRYSTKNLIEKVMNSGLVIIQESKEEGIIRNSFFTLKLFGWMVRFIKGPIVIIVEFLDKLSIPFFGESNIHLLAQKP